MTAPRELRVGVLVLSDRCARGERDDRSGPALAAWLRAEGVADALPITVLPDDRALIAAWLRETCDEGACDLVLTCGGTGVAPRDVTPDATRSILDIELPGFGEAMRAAGRRVEPRAIIGRGLAGFRAGVLVINLPGSPKAAVESLGAVWPAVAHAVAKAQGDPDDCAS